VELGGPDVGTWVFGLIDRDDAVRGRALARHQALVAASSEALHWSNRVWRQAGGPVPKEPHLAAEMDQARAEHRWHRDQTIFGYVDAFLDADPRDAAVRAVYWPFVPLYLRWEALYPDAWRAPESNLWSAWGRKEGVLRQLGLTGVPDDVVPDAAELVVSVIQRPYRCKDWMFALLVRHVAGAEFRGRVVGLTDSDDPLVRLRARFVLELVDHPEVGVTRTAWRQWLGRQTSGLC
jgi:hypothetical protein